ncbi:hypothetical protein Tco_1145051 [Tanacetum coccineum]
MVSASKDPLTFKDPMATPINFSNIELEYNFQECFNALTDKLDWNNPEGDQYLKTSDLEVTYTTSITKTKASRYEIKGIEDMISKFSKQNVYSTKAILGVKSVSVKKLHGYDMLLLAVQHKLFHLDKNVIIDFIVALRMFTRILILKRHVEDLQLGVKSYQKKLNITKPDVSLLYLVIGRFVVSTNPNSNRLEDLSRAGPTSGIRAWREPLLKKLYYSYS